MVKVKIKFDDENFVPEYAHEGDVGMDLRAYINNSMYFKTSGSGLENRYIILRPNEVMAIPVGFTLELPDGYEAQIRPRSGLALNHNISVLNSPATIDTGYRGLVKVILVNHGEKNFKVCYGDRIAQMVIKEAPKVEFIKIDVKVNNTTELSETERQDGGFGSTGVK